MNDRKNPTVKDSLTVPSPGSPEAVEMGCTCPVIDNCHGKGVPINGKPYFIMFISCPLHGERNSVHNHMKDTEQ